MSLCLARWAPSCLIFIISLSVPLSALLFVMLRRACPLQPGSLPRSVALQWRLRRRRCSTFSIPTTQLRTDLTVHAIAVALVVVANRALGGRIFTAPNFALVGVTARRVRSN